MRHATSTAPLRLTTLRRSAGSIAPLWRVLRFVVVAWVVADVVIGIAVHRYGRPVPLRQADVIVVLGSAVNRDGSAGPTLARRSRYAAALWKDGHAPVLLCTGGQAQGSSQSEAAACKEVLVDSGVDARAIYLEDRSHSTEENALHSRRIMQAQGWRHALLVTDPFHMLRAGWIFADYGLSCDAAPVPRDQIATGWYLNRLGREVMALQWQALKTLLRLPATSVPVG